MQYIPQPTANSTDILLSFPQEIVLSILGFFLGEELYNGNRRRIWKSFSCQVTSFSDVVRITRGVRGACRPWAETTRSLVFGGKSTRQGLILELPRLMLDEEINLFPSLRDCAVRLCHPYRLREVYAMHQKLGNMSESSEYISMVHWETDDLMDMMRGAVEGMGYGPVAGEFTSVFAEECIAIGLKIADERNKRPNGGDLNDSSKLMEAGLRALKNFTFKELLAIWYYNAHIARQIISAFPNLQYLDLPDFLHIPLVAKMQYFFPQLVDESIFAPVSLSPPRMLQHLGMRYERGGRQYSEIMTSLKSVNLLNYHYNPILAMFPRRLQCTPFRWSSFLIYNGWYRRSQFTVGSDLIRMFRELIQQAILDIPKERMPKLLNHQILKGAMDEPCDSD